MKKLVFLAFLAIAAAARAEMENSGGDVILGAIGCERETWLKDAIKFHENRDEQAMKRYLKNGRCYALRHPVSSIILSQKLSENYYAVHALINGKKLWVEVDGATSSPLENAQD